jgi:putative transport protein
MTSTPALGVLSSVTDSNVPAVSYAAAYPVALILMTMVARALVGWVA